MPTAVPPPCTQPMKPGCALPLPYGMTLSRTSAYTSARGVGFIGRGASNVSRTSAGIGCQSGRPESPPMWSRVSSNMRWASERRLSQSLRSRPSGFVLAGNPSADVCAAFGDAVHRFDEDVDLVERVVEGERRPHCRLDAHSPKDRLGAMMPGADGDAFGVECLPTSMDSWRPARRTARWPSSRLSPIRRTPRTSASRGVAYSSNACSYSAIRSIPTFST